MAEKKKLRDELRQLRRKLSPPDSCDRDRLADDVLAGVREQVDKERLVREKIASGAPLSELLAEFGHL